MRGMRQKRRFFLISFAVMMLFGSITVWAGSSNKVQSFQTAAGNVKMYESAALIAGPSWWDNVQGRAQFLTTGTATDLSFPTVTLKRYDGHVYATSIFSTQVRSFSYNKFGRWMAKCVTITIDLNGDKRSLTVSY